MEHLPGLGAFRPKNPLPTGLLNPGRAGPPTIIAGWPDQVGENPLELYAAHNWHSIFREGLWDLDGLLEHFAGRIWHSVARGLDGPPDEIARRWGAVVFAPEEGVFVIVTRREKNRWALRVWADSPERAAAHLEPLRERFLRPERSRRDTGQFFILTVTHGGLESRTVTLEPDETHLEDVSLHYGSDFREWHDDFKGRLQQKKTGISLFQGPPGTGKTSYIRRLLYELADTHRFYYLPLSAYPYLTAPYAVEFWLDESLQHKAKTKVVVLEDAESLLIQRGSDNQELVSSLLNLADGFLGDFLRMQVICTINAPIDKLDPAIVRPGRLVNSRHFRRLTPVEAQGIAQAKGFTLSPQEDYSLAEVYNSAATLGSRQLAPQIGFDALADSSLGASVRRREGSGV